MPRNVQATFSDVMLIILYF